MANNLTTTIKNGYYMWSLKYKPYYFNKLLESLYAQSISLLLAKSDQEALYHDIFFIVSGIKRNLDVSSWDLKEKISENDLYIKILFYIQNIDNVEESYKNTVKESVKRMEEQLVKILKLELSRK
jgi:hypothetical protein